MSSTPEQNYQTFSNKPIATGVIVHDAVPGQNQPNLFWLSYAWRAVMHHLLRGHEPRVWQKRNAAGEVFYYGYDPRTKSSIQCSTETEMREWLDQLPYC